MRTNTGRTSMTPRSAGMRALSDDELRQATGGTGTVYNTYYDVSTGRYTQVPDGQVYVGAGLLVGQSTLTVRS